MYGICVEIAYLSKVGCFLKMHSKQNDSSAVKKQRSTAGGQKRSSGTIAQILSGRPKRAPPPQPPKYCPSPVKKDTNLLLFKIRIHLHTNGTQKWNSAEL